MDEKNSLEREGATEKATGTMKEEIGGATGDAGKVAEGAAERASGAVKENVGEATREAVEEATTPPLDAAR